MTILALLGLILPIPAGAMWIRRKWHKLQAAIPKETVDVALGGRRDDRLGADGLGRALTAQVTAARVATSIAGLASVDAAVIERAAAVVRRAVKSGDAATQLVRANGLSYYLVALPVKHARPQVVARYLGTEWPAHLESIRASTGGPVVALVVLCAPDATEATLLVASIDGTGTATSDPDALLDAKEARARNANTFRGQMSLAVSPPITTEKAA
ncbi:MAG: hypothetical protein NT062_15685 [Proteobacteria bacterium]|nr:hypothetical protein [Pseudomonadota bacterium]